MGEYKYDLTIIIPTIGRDTLERTIQSITQQEYQGDIEILIIGDSYDNKFSTELFLAESVARRYNATYLEHDGGLNCFGHPQRNYGQRIAQGEYIAYLQDDDVYTPRSMDAILKSIKRMPMAPRLFKTLTWQAGVVWKTQELFCGNIDADCIVVPNVPDRFGEWQYNYVGDFDYIKDTCVKWDRIVWEDYIIARGRPSNYGAD